MRDPASGACGGAEASTPAAEAGPFGRKNALADALGGAEGAEGTTDSEGALGGGEAWAPCGAEDTAVGVVLAA